MLSNFQQWIDVDYFRKKKKQFLVTLVKVFEGAVAVFRRIGADQIDQDNSVMVKPGQWTQVGHDLPLTIKFLPGYIEILPRGIVK